MRRRRGSRGSWFPVEPTFYEGFDQIGFSWTEETLTMANAAIQPGLTSIKAIPLTMDETQTVGNSGSPGVSLRDYVQGQDYICKRVVGNTWFNHPGAAAFDGGGLILRSICCLALAVLPAAEDGTPALPAEEWHPLLAQNAQQPWLWRRTWQLGDVTRVYLPGTTSWIFGTRDGGFLDTKGVSRRVTKEQRLFLIAAAGVLDTAGESQQDEEYSFGYDLRIFGAMRNSRNRSTFS